MLATPKALSLAGASLLISLTAFADPWDRGSAPPHTFRPDISMRGTVDGRGDLHEAATARMDIRPAERPQAERMSHAAPQMPLKSEIAIKAHPGDEGDNVAANNGPKPESQAQQKGTMDLMGRQLAGPPVHLKTQILLKIQSEQAPDADPAAKNPGQKNTGAQKALSPKEIQKLEKMTGLKLPQTQLGSDDPDDKTM